jgi:type IV pilus assembly protein PilQ
MMRKRWSGLCAVILLAGLIAVNGGVGVAQSPSDATSPALVRGVAVSQEGGRVTLSVQASGPLGYETRTLAGPPRLVVDLPQSILVARERQLAVDDPAVKGVRLGQFQSQPPVTRLVVDLTALVPYDVQPSAEGLLVILESPAPAPAEPAAAPETRSEPTLIASLAPMVPAASRTAAPAPAEPVLLAKTIAPPAPAPAAAAPQEPAVGQAAPKYTGEPISVNLKDVDLKDFFRLIHEISGLNIVVDPDVSGSVTLVLIDVPWDQALDIVLRNNGLSSTLEGNVLRIATRSRLKSEQEETRDLAKAREEAAEPVVVTRQLSYAQAAELEPTLKKFLTSRGEIIRDARTNTLIIRDVPAVIPRMDDIIKQLDRKSLQVEIEARVVQASRAFSRELGTNLAFSAGTGNRRSVVGGGLAQSSPFGPGFLPPPLIVGGTQGQQPLVTNFPGTPTSALLFGNTWANVALDVILSAAENRNIAKILSKPRVITQNNVQAEIKQGTRIPVQTVVNNTISTQFIDVPLRLLVKPQITAEGTIFLDIVIEKTAIDPGIARINGIPALATVQATTQVLLDDGGTVVIGGIMLTDNSTTTDQVPVLGSIPVIGYLFKRTRWSTSTQELLLFVTPRILQG